MKASQAWEFGSFDSFEYVAAIVDDYDHDDDLTSDYHYDYYDDVYDCFHCCYV